MKEELLRERISKYISKWGIKRTWIAEKIGRSPTLVTLMLDGSLNITESNLLKINRALFEEDKSKYFKSDHNESLQDNRP